LESLEPSKNIGKEKNGIQAVQYKKKLFIKNILHFKQNQ